jgi:hypothetical protein
VKRYCKASMSQKLKLFLCFRQGVAGDAFSAGGSLAIE